MQGIQQRCPNELLQLDLNPTAAATTTTTTTASSTSFSIDEDESAEDRIQRLISEHPVIIFSKSSCCMCHVMKNLLATIGVIPTVIELDDEEIAALPTPHDAPPCARKPYAPSLFIGGTAVGGLESLVALHLSGHLKAKLVEVGALYGYAIDNKQ